jgi:N-acetylglucosamine-6-sulfatase
MRRDHVRLMLAVGVFVMLLAGLTTATKPTKDVAGRAVSPGKPNIVFVLTDDLSWNLVPYMSQVRELQREGTTFNDYVVTDSLCCPSRASIFTGRFPHDTGVFTNGGKDGGFHYFHNHGEEADTFATALQGQGYRTALMGKYLNEYQPTFKAGGTEPYVPLGWSEWDVAGGGYGGYHYKLNENHDVVEYGGAPEEFLPDVLAGKGAAFIKRSARAHDPFLLEVSTFTPHAPYTAAQRHLDEYPDLTAPRTPQYNKLPTAAPPWLRNRGPLPAAELTAIDHAFRKRVLAVQAVDDLIGTLRAALESAGVADNTYVVFSSDNGYHMGEYRLAPGKMSAFDTDIRVPLVVAGPGVSRGTRNISAVSNIDLAPTFEAAGGAPVPATVDGHSLLPLLHGSDDTEWRTANLVEHHGPVVRPDDPDRPEPGGGNPPDYAAIRTHTFTYVEYVDGSREYYDLTNDRDQMHNLAGSLSAIRLRELHSQLTHLTTCHSGATCWTAGHV